MSAFFQIPEFLPPLRHNIVRNVARFNRDHFVTATVNGDSNFRKAKVLHATDFPGLYKTMSDDVRSVLPSVYHMLCIPEFHVTQLEMQMTAHGNGDYFKTHNDNGSPDCLERTISYVYYFDVDRPRRYTGGELRIIEEQGEATIIPMDNSIVFFNSSLLHEVKPIQCESDAFEHSRFTINGWLRR